MKKEYINRNLFRTLYFLGLLLCICSCSVEEDMEDCDFTAKVRAVLPGTRFDNLKVDKVTFYVFNSAGTLLETRQSELNKIEEFFYPYEGELSVYVLANDKDGINETVNAAPGGIYEGSCVNLIEIAPTTGVPNQNYAVYNHPSDLLLGDESAPNSILNPNHVTDVPIHLIVGSACITMRKAKEYFNATSDDFSFLILPRYHCVNFDRTTVGDIIAMKPAGSFVKADEYEVAPFRFFSSTHGEPIAVYVFHEGTLVDTITTDRYGEPLVSYNGKLLDMLIDYSGNLTVSVQIMPWGEKYTWKEFGR